MSRLFASTSTVGAHRGPRSLGDRAVRGLVLFIALMVATLGLPTVISQTAASAATRVTPADNPDLVPSCGLDVVLVLDASGSIATSNAQNDVKSAANTFLDAFKDTNTRVGIVKFNTKAETPALGLTTVTTASTSSGGAHYAAVNSYSASGRTNWQDALLSAKNVFTSATPRAVPKLIVFVTDGAPNTVNNGSGTTNYSDAAVEAVDPAVTQMNAIKALGVHSLVVAAGQAFNDTSPANARIDALYRVSQYPTPKIYPATPFDAATTDLILQKDFSALKDTLRQVANQICDGILTVTKYASSADAPNTYVKQGTGWDFTTTVSPAGDWIKPSTGSGASKSATTDVNGMTLFQWNPGTANWSKTATVTDTGKANYTPDHVTCQLNGQDVANPTLNGSDFNVAVGAGKQVACNVYNKYTGKPNTDVGITKTVSAASVTVGDTVTWTLKAQNYGPNTATNVKFTDVLPAGLGSVTNVTASAGSYSAGVWTIPSLAVGAGNAQTLTFKTTVDTAGDHTNNVSLTSLNETDTNPANDSDSATVKGVKADVTVTKSVNTPTQVVGTNVVWTITAKNIGQADAKNVKVVDTFGPDVAYVMDDGAGAYDPATRTWTIGTLAAGASVSLHINTNSGVAGVKTNAVHISTSTPETDENNNDASAKVCYTIADLKVTKTVSDHDVLLGDDVTWTITVKNTGDATAKDVVVTDTVPAGLTVVSTDPDGALVGNTWTVGDLAPGASATLTITTTVNSLDPVTNEACAATTTPESTKENNCDEDTVSATAADVSVTKVPDLSEVYINGTVIWTVQVLNTGKADAANVVVTDLAPAGLTLGSGVASQGTYGSGTWNVGLVPGTVNAPQNGGSATLTLTSTVGTMLGQLTNKVDVTTDTPETDTTNNHGEGTVNVTAADVTITKTADKHDVYLGDTVVWTITAKNNGPATAHDVVVTDVVPAGLQVTGVSPIGALVGSTWNVGTLAGNGGTQVLTLTTKAIQVGRITNKVDIVTSTPETDPSNNHAEDTVCVTSAEVSVTKTADNHTPVLDGTVVWTVKVTNSGSADAQNVVVTDVVPDGLSVVSTDPADALVNNAWNVGTLGKGMSVTLTITTRTTQTGEITNTACAATSTPEGNTEDNCGHDTVTVTAPKVSVTKVADTTDAVLGDSVTWTVKATNTGDADALNTVVNDVVPSTLTVTNSTATQGSYDAVTGVWDIGTLAKGDTVTLTLTTTVGAIGPVTNTACIETSSAQMPSEDPKCGHDTVDVHAPIVNITKTADDHAPGYQGTVVWTITASNTGDAAAQNVVANDTVPAGLHVDSFDAPQGTTFDSATGVWTIGTLAANTSVTLTLSTTVQQLGELTNTVCVATSTPQVDETQKCGHDTVTVTAPNLVITKVASTDTALPGDQLTWTITVTNTGDRDAQGVVVNDNRPDGLTVDSANPSQGSYNLATDVWTVGDVAKNGGTATLTLTTTVEKAGELTNEACVTTTDAQVDGSARCAHDTVTVTGGLVLTKTNEPTGTVKVGDTISYTLAVKIPANGASNQQHVVVTDYIPGYDPTTPSATTTYVADSAKCVGTLLPVVGTCDVALTKNGSGKVTKITWSLGTMEPGQTLDVVFKVTADDQPNADSDSVTIYNVGSVKSDSLPATPSNKVSNTLDLTEVLGIKTPAPGGGVLAATGSDLFREIGIALSLLLVGAFLLRGARRRDEELGEH